MHSHDHSHSHGHTHGHGPGEGAGGESYSARRHPEAVILDIGGAVGALVVHAGADMHGVEVEISATGEDERRAHKEVLEREINGVPAFTAVFDKVHEGSYTLWVEDVARARDVVVTGGAISELDWTRERFAPRGAVPRAAA